MILSKLRSTIGQGLLEATIAIGVVMVGLIGTVTLTTSTIVSSAESEGRIVAANLAREGIEAVRVIRDSNWLQGSSIAWDTGLSSGLDVTAIPTLDPQTFQWSLDFTATDLSDSRTKLWRSNGVYRQLAIPIAGATPTPYSRLLELHPIYCNAAAVSPDVICPSGLASGSKVGLRVVSIVQWTEAGRDRKLSLEDWLYNWRFAPPSYVP